MFRFWMEHISEVTLSFYADYVNDTEDNGGFCAAIKHNDHSLMLALHKAMDDLCTYAERHLGKDEKKPDRHKYAGFIAKWIAKIRPFYLDYLGNEEIPKHLLSLNAYYAAYVFKSFLVIEGNVPPRLLEILLYTLDFRDEPGENLSFVAYTWELAANSSANNPLLIPVV